MKVYSSAFTSIYRIFAIFAYCLLPIALFGQTLIAGWDFQTTSNGGTLVLASPNTPTAYVANFGAGNLYLNGTSTSSTWLQASELNGFGGSALNAGAGFSTNTAGASCLSLVNNTANNKRIVFSFNMTGYQNLVVSYDTRGTSTGFSSQLWEYSTNGTTWTNIQTVTGTTVTTFFTQTLTTITGLNNAATAYLRMTVAGATSSSGNNRLDNIQLNASAIATSPPAITSVLTKTSLQGLAISPYTITASNSPTVFHATGLPPGIVIDTLTGQLTGTPTTLGTYNVTISATNPYGTGTATLVFTINPQTPVITNALSTIGTINLAFTFTLTANNSPASFSASNLPPGLNIDTNTGIISGTPTSTGTYNVPISATNVTGTDNKTLVITIYPPVPVITSTLTATGTEGTPISNYVIIATNSPSSYGASNLPTGLSIDTNTGIISGTPTVNGTFNVTITATNAGGTDTEILVFTISPPATPTITLDMSSFIAGGAFGTQCINTSSSVSTYQVSGTYLTGNIVITAPAGFEISLSNAPFTPTNPITLIQNSGNVAITTIYVRYSPTIAGATAGLMITHTSPSAISQNIAVSGTGDATPPSAVLGMAINIDTTSAVINNTTFINNCFAVTSSGICYSQTPFPTTANNTLNNAGNSSPFTSNLTGLSPNTTYYYRSYLNYSNGGAQTAYSIQDTFTTLKREPTEFPSAFSCGAATYTSLALNWIDGDSTQAPDGYLIKWSDVAFSSIIDPLDGIAQANGATTQNVAQGIQNYTLTGLLPAFTYYFKIWSYTNTGTGINYKLLNEPQSSCTTLSYQQAGTATYTFSAGTANAATTIPNLTLSPVTQGNNNGTTTLITNTSVSSGYAGATGTYNAGAAARIGALNTNAGNSAYFELSLSPNAGYTVELSAVSFGSRSTSTGPQAYAIRTSLDNYASNVVTGTFLNNSIWALSTPTIPILLSPLSTPLTLRIYGYNGTGSPAINIANWRVDDISLTVEVASSRTITTDTLNDLTLCEGQAFTVPYLTNISFLSGNTFQVQLSDSTGAWSTPTVLGSAIDTTSGNITATLPLGKTGSGYRVRVIGDMPTTIGMDNAQDITIFSKPTAPTNIVTSPHCGSVDLTANGVSSGIYTWYENPLAIAPIIGTGYTITVFDTAHYYVFDVANGCYSNATSFYLSAVPALPTVIPATNGTNYMATGECEDFSGWTHYYDASNRLLLSIQKNGVLTGTIGDGVFGVTIGGDAGAPAANGAVLIPQNYPTNYVQSTNWYTMNRYWTVTPNGAGVGGQITGNVNVRFYFKDADVQAVAANVGGIVSPEDLYFYKINGAYTTNPNPSSNHSNIPQATSYNTNGYWQYSNGISGSTSTWLHGSPSANNHYAQFTVGAFSGGGGGGSNNFGAFPIILSAFTGQVLAQSNELAWTTESEVNADRFEIYRSGDNKLFEKIGEVAAEGHGANYHFTDKQPINGLNYYQLKMIDTDGKYQHSAIIELHSLGTFNYAVYPNPANDKLFVSVHSPEKHGIFRIYDALGNKVYEIDLNHNILNAIDISALGIGLYIYQIHHDGAVSNGKLMIER